MLPHERSLVQRLAGAPFALIGINSDRDRERIKKVLQEKTTWRSFWDGGGTDGPIATRWNVRTWPAIYVLDAGGVIRFKGVRDVEMDRAVDSLLREMGARFTPAKNIEPADRER